MRLYSKIIIILSIFLFFSPELKTQSIRNVEIIRANSLEYDDELGINAKRLLGDVVFKHDDVFMFCDSAYFYDLTNFIEAFSMVRIVQGDSLLLFGQKMRYCGNTKLAQMRDSVILKHNDSFLMTDSLDFDRNTEIGYYFGGGTIYDEDNILSSLYGYYHSIEGVYYAVNEVELNNPQYIIYTDSLKYDTNTGIAYFFGPTTIISDENTIYCELGFYDTENDISRISKNASIVSGANELKGDSIFYDRNRGFGEAFKNVSIYDSVENITALGNYGYYYEDPEKAMITDSLMIIHVTDNDSLFMSSDTVYIYVDENDEKIIKAFYKVQMFRHDMQARCDSLYYSSEQLIAEMFYDPIAWLEESQLSSDLMKLYFDENNNLNHAKLLYNAFIVEPVDSSYYNQIKGRKVIAYFDDNELNMVEIFSDAETLYFVEDDETKDWIAMNKAISANMRIHLKDRAIQNIWFFQKPDGVAIPIKDVTQEQLFLENFKWHEKIRPKSKEDIFIWKEISED